MSEERKTPLRDKPVRKGLSALERSRIKVTNLLENVERTYLPLDSRIGKYRIVEEIDRGGMAVVYKAYQTDLDRLVALKVLPANITINRKFVERFLSEAHAVARLSHPNIVSIHEVSMENNIYFLAMDYIPGKNLFFYLNYRKPKLVEVVDICVQLADAMAFAHGKKIVHRDLKLNNVIMKDNHVPVLIDFGLAKALGDEEDQTTKTGEIMGSPAYMAPERILGGQSDERSDICSLGIMLYEMLTFKNPYLDPRSIHQTTINVIEANPIPPRKLVAWLPFEIESVCLKAMSKNPEDRYQSMVEFREDLRRFQRGEQVLANPPSWASRARHFAKKHWAGLTIAMLIALFASLTGVLLYLQNQREQWHWQCILGERFEDAAILRHWQPHAADSGGLQLAVTGGRLAVDARSSWHLLFNRTLTQDVRLEFDLHVPARQSGAMGCFLYGVVPDSAYRFVVGYGPLALCGLLRPRSSQLLHEYESAGFTRDTLYRIEVERIGPSFLLRVNGVDIVRITDDYAPRGPSFRQVGLCGEAGRCWIDNVRLYRRVAPMLASPTIIAERFFAAGDYASALEEYQELQLDFPLARFRHQISLRIADCLLHLNRPAAAREILDGQGWLRVGDENLRVYVLALKARLYELENEPVDAQRCHNLIATLYPTHAMNTSLLLAGLDRCEVAIAQGLLDSADRHLRLLAQRYPRLHTFTARMHLQVMQDYAQRFATDTAQSLGEAIRRLYSRNDEVVSAARVLASRLHLGKGEKARALDLLNQSIAGHRPLASVWDAWLLLAEVYEYDGSYADALAIYRKISQECPPVLPQVWQARLRLGELAALTDDATRPADLFRRVAQGSHPFALQRAAARWYLDSLSIDTLRATWERAQAADARYLYFVVRSALLKGECYRADVTLQELLGSLPVQSWDYVRLYRLHEALPGVCRNKTTSRNETGP